MPRIMLSSIAAGVTLAALAATGANAQYANTYQASANGLPAKTETGQTGTNNCGTGSDPNSQCQNVYLNSVDDWCLFGPPVQGTVSGHEGDSVSYCTKSGRGTRLIPDGTITGASFVYSSQYVQVTGNGDFTRMNVDRGDAGGELDPHGADGTGNPKGGLVFHCANGKCTQMHEWMEFLSDTIFCIRGCYDGDQATSLCRHTYDELGCGFNMPANYPTGVFESCDSAVAQDIAFYDGTYFAQTMTLSGTPVPNPHPAPASSNCANIPGQQLYGAVSGDPFGGVTTANNSTATAPVVSSSPSVPATTAPVIPATTSSPVPSNTTTSIIPSITTSSTTSSSDSQTVAANNAASESSTTQPNGPHAYISGAAPLHTGWYTAVASAGLASLVAGVFLL
ncbi:unnamed protein product [Jaminaea pallidilutea]